ncbi:MAG: NADH:flavin oxidoreductase/NADH oxidase family protein [Myxococcota bacterium]
MTTALPSSRLAEPLTLPCGHVIPNRLVKAAMSEVLADAGGSPSEALSRLYERWARGGAGLLLTGNVIFDARGRTEPDNVVLPGGRAHEAELARWVERTHAAGSQLWMQISHAGRQASNQVVERPVAPSPVGVKGFGPLFRVPAELEADEIERLADGYALTAETAQRAGFAGVQIHGAHGYLVSQFLSPRTNLRRDAWGGTPEKNRRFLLEIVRRTRARVGSAFPIAVKLNSADFQRGGFSEEESLAVVEALAEEGIDLLEVSGGNYESPAMTGLTTREGELRASTAAREAYFLSYAEAVRARTSVPIMLTGGLRSAEAMAEVVASGAAQLIGIARPLCTEPDLPRELLSGEKTESAHRMPRVGVKAADSMLQIYWYRRQIHRLAAGKEPAPALSKFGTLGVAAAEQLGFSRPRNGKAPLGAFHVAEG